jgi:hypothetical protein
MSDNPSIVKDESGSNYGGISTGGSLGQAQMAYLENLQQMAMNMPPKAGAESQYFPGNSPSQVGVYSGSMVGHVPIFAPQNLLPFGVLDEAMRNKAEQEANYYKTFKTYLDKPISDIKAKLSNPFAQPEFNNKIQKTVDTWLDAYSKKFGGDYMKAYVALQNDRDFNKIMTGYAQYADIYNSVFKDATETLVKAKSPDDYYVSEDQVAAINKFLHAHDSLEDLSIDQLGKRAEEFAAKQSVFKLAEAATAGSQVDIIEELRAAPSMSSEEEAVYIKTKTSGSATQGKTIFDAVVKAHPWLKNDEAQRELLKTEIDNRIKYGVEKSLEKVKKEHADRQIALNKIGVTDDKGNVQFKPKVSAVVGSMGLNSVSYPQDKNKPIPTVSNMQVYIRDAQGRVKRVTLPDSYNMIPTAEYDLTDGKAPVVRGRYIEGTVNFQSTESYQPEILRTAQKGGKITPYSLGEGKASTQVKPVQAVDESGQIVELIGNTTILTPFELMRGQIEANIEHMDYVHKELEKRNLPFADRREYTNALDPGYTGGKKESIGAGTGLPTTDAIEVPDDADLSFFKNDPNVLYNYGGKILSGAYIHQNTN